MVGALFWDLGERHDYESILSRAAVSFYCVAFFIFMSVAVLPFTVMERGIVDKEVLNKYYHPIAYQVAQGLASIPGAGLLAFLVSLIVVTMLKLNDPCWYFLDMFLALTTSEALAQLVSHVVPHFVIGMAVLAGLFGFFMLFQGFMILPSDFPDWLRWTYNVAFHTYSWRSFMVTEFRGEEFPGTSFSTGEDVLEFYEIENTNRGNDVSIYLMCFYFVFVDVEYDFLTLSFSLGLLQMIVLACYALVLNLLSFVVLQVRHTWFRGTIVPLSKEKVASIEIASSVTTIGEADQSTGTTTTTMSTITSVSEFRQSVVKDLVGHDTAIVSPFEWQPGHAAQVPLVYCDFTASHRPSTSIERYLWTTCLPYYGNTHTNTSITGSQSTAFCAEARQLIAEACGAKTTGKASHQDVVLFA
jgi:hypothetical protein